MLEYFAVWTDKGYYNNSLHLRPTSRAHQLSSETGKIDLNEVCTPTGSQATFPVHGQMILNIN
ncbi:hypothetical protein RvY_16871 [Ramazzottius varieornatus]|uniref:Uncharacterized protein n=1 Tax=Ramazzottius varieornatus TaxID=947166 RepID=A0A1D1W027_RAMVA|nr:hypothetical protein RvY_16871 [Ramazzottius varieornatus]